MYFIRNKVRPHYVHGIFAGGATVQSSTMLAARRVEGQQSVVTSMVVFSLRILADYVWLPNAALLMIGGAFVSHAKRT